MSEMGRIVVFLSPQELIYSIPNDLILEMATEGLSFLQFKYVDELTRLEDGHFLGKYEITFVIMEAIQRRREYGLAATQITLEIIDHLQKAKIPVAIVTQTSLEAVEHTLMQKVGSRFYWNSAIFLRLAIKDMIAFIGRQPQDKN